MTLSRADQILVDAMARRIHTDEGRRAYLRRERQLLLGDLAVLRRAQHELKRAERAVGLREAMIARMSEDMGS